MAGGPPGFGPDGVPGGGSTEACRAPGIDLHYRFRNSPNGASNASYGSARMLL